LGLAKLFRKEVMKVSFLIPLRGREHQVDSCLKNIDNYYSSYDYEVIFAYQKDNFLFKRGQLINLAAKKAKGDMFVIQDVDTRHLRKLDLYSNSHGFVGFNKREKVFDIGDGFVERTGKYVGRGVGALVIVPKQRFFDSFGFSNIYFGYGNEDYSFVRQRAKLSMLPGVLGHADHPITIGLKDIPPWRRINLDYLKFERTQHVDYSCDSVCHTIADELGSEKINEKVIIYYFSNIRVSKDFGRMEWYSKQVKLDKE